MSSTIRIRTAAAQHHVFTDEGHGPYVTIERYTYEHNADGTPIEAICESVSLVGEDLLQLRDWLARITADVTDALHAEWEADRKRYATPTPDEVGEMLDRERALGEA